MSLNMTRSGSRVFCGLSVRAATLPRHKALQDGNLQRFQYKCEILEQNNLPLHHQIAIPFSFYTIDNAIFITSSGQIYLLMNVSEAIFSSDKDRPAVLKVGT